MTKIYLIRHGQTVLNVEHKIAGQIETELTDLGRQQALDLAQKLKNDAVSFDAILCSDLKRAKETASIIASIIKTPIIYDADLREFSNGIYEGMKVKDLQQMQFSPPYHTAGFEFSNGADLYAAYSSFDKCYDEFAYPQGETKTIARERFMKAIERHIIDHPDIQNLGVVAHGAVIRFMLLKICPEILKEKITNAEVRIVFYDRKDSIFKAKM